METIRVETREDGRRVLVRLLAFLENPVDLLNRIGAHLAGLSQAAFVDERYGTDSWPKQYPGMDDEEFLHVAGILSDLNAGGRIKERRFRRKVPLHDTGELAGSITHKVLGKDAVEVGTTVDYAATHQFGLLSEQTITKQARRGLYEFLYTPTGKPRKARVKFRDRLGWMFTEDLMITDVAERPFLGMTDEAEKDIREITEAELKFQAEEAIRGDE